MPRIDAPGGVITSAVDFVRILTGAYDLARDGVLLSPNTVTTALAAPVAPVDVDLGGFAQDLLGNGVIAHGKSGVLWGVASQVIYRSDGISIAVFVNKSNAHASRTSWTRSRERRRELADAQPVPQHGLPAFTRIVPRVHTVTTSSLPNVTDSAYVVEGEVLSGVDRIDFEGTSITSRLSTSWANGWFRIVDDRNLEIYPPQGLIAGTYSLRLWNGLAVSNPFDVTVTRATTRTLGGPGVVVRRLRADRVARCVVGQLAGAALLQLQQQPPERAAGDRQPRHRRGLHAALDLARGAALRALLRAAHAGRCRTSAPRPCSSRR